VDIPKEVADMKKRMLSAAALAALVSSATLGCGGQVTQTSTSTVPVLTSTSGGYLDGTYTGDPVKTHYGDVQVQVVVEEGAMADVQFLAYPTGHESDQINAYAAPMLAQEAIESQSANVDAISGATMTSEAFVESLGAALDQAI
jgi:uncharacterized protein with FMN-binding domain